MLEFTVVRNEGKRHDRLEPAHFGLPGLWQPPFGIVVRRSGEDDGILGVLLGILLSGDSTISRPLGQSAILLST